ncbi:MAG TPA: TRAP transporter small permease subunit [Synergistaceae bacterium]|mgnify:CR=1 FL=1|nr:TRAP transporter small permease subunit [Synergistaceae bacterium]HQF90873.1 TRAP transporter small permease subunit [Synergistaceae bacterium]
MTAMADRLQRISRTLERVSAVGAGALLVVNVADVLLGIVCRYVFRISLVWTEEVARYSLVWLALLGAGCAAARGDHMALDFLVPRLPRAPRLVVEVLRLAFVLAVLLALAVLGWKNLAGTWEVKTMALGVPKAALLLALPVGMLLLGLQLFLGALLPPENSERTEGP